MMRAGPVLTARRFRISGIMRLLLIEAEQVEYGLSWDWHTVR